MPCGKRSVLHRRERVEWSSAHYAEGWVAETRYVITWKWRSMVLTYIVQ